MMCAAVRGECAFTNDGVRLEFDAPGRVSSLKELRSGRELIRATRPFATIVRKNGRPDRPVSFSCDGGGLVYSFANGDKLSFRVEAFGGGWTFGLRSVRCDDSAKEIMVCEIAPTCSQKVVNKERGKGKETFPLMPPIKKKEGRKKIPISISDIECRYLGVFPPIQM